MFWVDQAEHKGRVIMRLVVVFCALTLLLMAVLLNFRGYVFVNILFMIAAAACLVSAFFPSLSLKQKTGDLSPDITDGIAQSKVEGLARFIRDAKKRVYMVTGEFHPTVFNSKELGKALKEAADRGADIQILMGDRDRHEEEELRKHLLGSNGDLLSQIMPFLRNGKVKFFYDQRREDHFHVIDNTVIVEERHGPKETTPWHYRENTWFLADKKAGEFAQIRSKKRLMF